MVLSTSQKYFQILPVGVDRFLLIPINVTLIKRPQRVMIHSLGSYPTFVPSVLWTIQQINMVIPPQPPSCP